MCKANQILINILEKYYEVKAHKIIAYDSNKIDEWKHDNCYSSNDECMTCLSGGMFWGSYCNKAMDMGIEDYIRLLPIFRYIEK
jgi:hypothetical protein